MEGESTNMEVDCPVVPTNNDQNDYEVFNGFDSDSERASTVTHVQFGEESEVAPNMADRALTGAVERMSTKEALAQPVVDAPGDLEMELQHELDCLEQSMADVEDALEEGTIHPATARLKEQAEAHQELFQDTLVKGAEHQDVGSIASTDRSAMQDLNKKAMKNKNKRQGGIAKWAPVVEPVDLVMVKAIIFSGLELAPSQQPPESEASTEHGLLHPEATISGHSHTSNDLDVPAVAREQLTSRELQGPVAESSGPVPHQDAQESRAEKVVTWINFEDWAKTMVQEEQEASLMLALEPLITTELRPETASPDDQPTTMMAELSQAAMA
ncbi:hypothetical protein IFM61606_10180 [Aspergillus udagawae]|nr:hypothetical protein IFM61606_10180 [Aspergillus udagawae]